MENNGYFGVKVGCSVKKFKSEVFLPAFYG